LFSLLFFHKFLIPALMQLLDELIANPSKVSGILLRIVTIRI
jgi:hypothetical protein